MNDEQNDVPEHVEQALNALAHSLNGGDADVLYCDICDGLRMRDHYCRCWLCSLPASECVCEQQTENTTMPDVQIGYVQGVLDLTATRFPTRAQLWQPQCGDDEHQRFEHDGDTLFGYVGGGVGCVLVSNAGRFWLKPGMLFSSPTPCRLEAREGASVLLIQRIGWHGLFNVHGPVEAKGRLRYIDGCSDTVCINPPRVGDPCFNHLHFPADITQTMHTHPSVRIGVVIAGRGHCVTPNGEFELQPGMLWYLPENQPHCFHTRGETLDVVAWHPDSDSGPSDENHPMLNRTLVDGVSAAALPHIRTTGEIRE